MSKHPFLSAAFVGISALSLTAGVANAATTVPAVKTASPVTKAPVVVTPSVKAPVVAKTVKRVKVGNFCKKVLVGKTAVDGAGATVHCVANTKGQPVWTL